MQLPSKSLTLTASQVVEIIQKLADMRHSVNNHLSLITAAAEIITRKPEAASQYINSLISQPQQICAEIRKFSDDLERALSVAPE